MTNEPTPIRHQAGAEAIAPSVGLLSTTRQRAGSTEAKVMDDRTESNHHQLINEHHHTRSRFTNWPDPEWLDHQQSHLMFGCTQLQMLALLEGCTDQELIESANELNACREGEID